MSLGTDAAKEAGACLVLTAAGVGFAGCCALVTLIHGIRIDGVRFCPGLGLAVRRPPAYGAARTKQTLLRCRT